RDAPAPVPPPLPTAEPSTTPPANQGGAVHMPVRSFAKAFPTQPDSVARDTTSLGDFGNQVQFLINPFCCSSARRTEIADRPRQKELLFLPLASDIRMKTVASFSQSLRARGRYREP